MHEPGFTEIGSAIRQLLLHANAGSLMRNETELLLFAASRAQLVGEVVRPALERAWLLYRTVSMIRRRFIRVLGEGWM